MSQEKLNHIVLGVLIDFVAFLTTQEEITVLSSHRDEAPVVEAIKTFLEKRDVEYADPLLQWPNRCTKASDCDESEETNDHIIEVTKKLCEKFIKKVETGRARSTETYQECHLLLHLINQKRG